MDGNTTRFITKSLHILPKQKIYITSAFEKTTPNIYDAHTHP